MINPERLFLGLHRLLQASLPPGGPGDAATAAVGRGPEGAHRPSRPNLLRDKSSFSRFVVSHAQTIHKCAVEAFLPSPGRGRRPSKSKNDPKKIAHKCSLFAKKEDFQWGQSVGWQCRRVFERRLDTCGDGPPWWNGLPHHELDSVWLPKTRPLGVGWAWIVWWSGGRGAFVPRVPQLWSQPGPHSPNILKGMLPLSSSQGATP